MTRNQAIDKVRKASSPYRGTPADLDEIQFIDALEALGLLDLETPEDAIQNSAVERLTGAHTSVHYALGTGLEVSAKLTASGAVEIIDVLTKSGFKITRT